MSTLRKRQHYEMMTEDSSDKGQVKKKKIITLASNDENSEN
jgi:ribosomal protein S21